MSTITITAAALQGLNLIDTLKLTPYGVELLGQLDKRPAAARLALAVHAFNPFTRAQETAAVIRRCSTITACPGQPGEICFMVGAYTIATAQLPAAAYEAGLTPRALAQRIAELL